ncbi:MAG: HNH endonuclease [Acidimicrobiales bacterium]
MTKTKRPKLTIEMVPSSSWGANLAQSLKGPRWDAIRKVAADKAGNRCELCGGVGTRHNVEVHERWEYDETTAVQRLVGLVALCPACHEVKHMGRASNIGRLSQALAHLASVNDWTANEAMAAWNEAIVEFRRRNEIEWTLELSLVARYGIDPPTAEELAAGRAFRAGQIERERRPKPDKGRRPR